jgi:MOSC domain-containing protein YiiM
VGDELHGPAQADGPALVLRVTAPRKPCGKFVAVMGYVAAARDMVRHGMCGWYLQVAQPGSVAVGDGFTLHPGPRRLCITEAIRAAGASVRH